MAFPYIHLKKGEKHNNIIAGSTGFYHQNSKYPMWTKKPTYRGKTADSKTLPLSKQFKYETGIGWVIYKNGDTLFYEQNPGEVAFSLMEVERMIGEDNQNEYTAQYESLTSSLLYQRHSKNNWVLVGVGPGIA
jgi:hypothetical protein